MLRQEVYQKTSEVFGTVVGVANVDYKNLDEVSVDNEFTPVTYKKASDEIDINNIICLAIDYDKYKELQKNLYKHNIKRHPKIKDVTIYKRAWEDTKWK